MHTTRPNATQAQPGCRRPLVVRRKDLNELGLVEIRRDETTPVHIYANRPAQPAGAKLPGGKWYTLPRRADGNRHNLSFPEVRKQPQWTGPWTGDLALKRYPRICAHVICHSLGYATPKVAAIILAAALNNELMFCEWINHSYGDDPVPAVRWAIHERKAHRGYMAEYVQALALVVAEMNGMTRPDMLASWF